MTTPPIPARERQHRDRLAGLAQYARMQLGLSIREAARLAEVSRATWTALEAGTRKTADHNHAGIERALRWNPGHIAGILTDPGELTRWHRLAQYVIARRVALGYRTRLELAAATNISIRILGDIETARRNRFAATTIARLENTLGWAPGSADRIVAGNEPELAHPPTYPGGTVPTEPTTRQQLADELAKIPAGTSAVLIFGNGTALIGAYTGDMQIRDAAPDAPAHGIKPTLMIPACWCHPDPVPSCPRHNPTVPAELISRATLAAFNAVGERAHDTDWSRGMVADVVQAVLTELTRPAGTR